MGKCPNASFLQDQRDFLTSLYKVAPTDIGKSKWTKHLKSTLRMSLLADILVEYRNIINYVV